MSSNKGVIKKSKSKPKKYGSPDFNRRKKEDGLNFKLWGIMSCKKCVEKWKVALQQKGHNVRVRESPTGWEIWITWQK